MTDEDNTRAAGGRARAEPTMGRNVAECERFAEQNGFTGAVAGHFPDLPFPPPPTFLPEPSVTLPPRHTRSAPIPRTIVDRVKLFNRNNGDRSDE